MYRPLRAIKIQTSLFKFQTQVKSRTSKGTFSFSLPSRTCFKASFCSEILVSN